MRIRWILQYVSILYNIITLLTKYINFIIRIVYYIDILTLIIQNVL